MSCILLTIMSNETSRGHGKYFCVFEKGQTNGLYQAEKTFKEIAENTIFGIYTL